MNVLAVHAEHAAGSFCGTLCRTAVEALKQGGHAVQCSDLQAMGFRTAAGPADFPGLGEADAESYAAMQRRAARTGRLAEDIVAEQEKLAWCDALLLCFPLWWFGMPALMKGWVDRVFTPGFAYGEGEMYDRGGLRGRRAMCAITTEASASTFGPRGLHGDLRDILYPIHHGILYYVGFEVLPPFVVYAPGHMDDETRAACLLEFEDRMLTLDTATPIPFPELADYDDAHQLRPAYRTAD